MDETGFSQTRPGPTEDLSLVHESHHPEKYSKVGESKWGDIFAEGGGEGICTCCRRLH